MWTFCPLTLCLCSGREDDCSDDDDGEGCGSVGDEEWRPATSSEVGVSPHSDTVHFAGRSDISLTTSFSQNLQSEAPVLFTPRTLNHVARIWLAGRKSPPRREVQPETNGSDVRPEDQSSVQAEPQPDQQETSGSQGGAATRRAAATPLTGSHALPAGPARLLRGTSRKVQPSSQSRGQNTPLHMSTHTGSQGPGQKRKRDLEVGSPEGGRDPVQAPSTKPWPVFTIAKPRPEGDR